MSSDAASDVAVVGIGCRFPPRSCGVEEFWSFLLEGGDAVGDVPADRWRWEAFYDPDQSKPGKMNVRRGAFLEQRFEEFDAAFFGVAPREVAQLDPQQRLLLEVSWEALEDAGLDLWSLRGSRTGVFVGAFMLDNLLQRVEPAAWEDMGPQTPMTCTNTMLASRLSYFYDLRGPSMAIDTACSSSLVALHHGVQALVSGDCDLVLVGGVNRIFRPEAHLMMSKGHFLAPDGRSKAFSANADGYGRGEGCGLVVLKRWADARTDGDRIYAVVEGTGVNQDGRTDGPAYPSAEAQASLIEHVLCKAKVDPRTISYVEAHGTGTPVGDPAEVEALRKAIGRFASRGQPCIVGSVKAGIGHTEAAAGIAGFIKAALVAQRGVVPPQAWLDELNPHLDLDASGLRVATCTMALEARERPVRVAVNSFGYGGTNAHAILRGPPTSPARRGSRADHGVGFFRPMLLLSGHLESAVAELAGACADLVHDAGPGERAGLVAGFAARTAHEHRRAVMGDPEGFTDLLGVLAAGGHHPDLLAGRAPGNQNAAPVFVFSGMGPQWWAMGRGLLEGHETFRSHLEECDRLVRELVGWSLLQELTRTQDSSRLHLTQFAQPANVAIQTGLVAVLAAAGVAPGAVVGHSVGEIAAAHAAGALDLADALTIACHRSRLQATVAGNGGMLATELSEDEADKLLASYGPEVSLAAVNGPTAVTLAGDRSTLAAIERELTARHVFCRVLRVEVAYHSPAIDAIIDELRVALSGIQPKAGAVRRYSTVDESLDDEPWDAEYWVANARQPVHFAAAARRIVRDGHRVLLEIGPHPVLSLYLHALTAHQRDAQVIATLHRGRPDDQALTEALAHLWLHGVAVDWRAVFGRPPLRPLPLYPWQRGEHWQESAPVRRTRTGDDVHTDALHGRRVSSVPNVWDIDLSPTTVPWCRHHHVDGTAVFPATGFLEVIASHARTRSGSLPVAIDDLRIDRPLVVSEHHDPVMRVTVTDDGHVHLASRSRGNLEDWRHHATARISRGRYTPPPPTTLEGAVATVPVDSDDLYRRLAARGLGYEGPFRAVTQVASAGDHVVVEARNHSDESELSRYTAYPPLLDALLHGAIAAGLHGPHDRPGESGTHDRLFLPVGIEQAVFYADVPPWVTARASLTTAAGGQLRASLDCYDQAGNCVATLRGIVLNEVVRNDPIQAWLDERTYEPFWRIVEPARRTHGGTGRWVVITPSSELTSECAQHATGADDLHSITIEPGEGIDLDDVPADISGVLLYLDPKDLGSAAQDSELALELVRRLDQSERSVEVVLATRHAVAVTPDDTVTGWLSGWVPGFRRAVANEARHVRARFVDHDGDQAALMATVLDTAVDEVAIRAGRYHQLTVDRRTSADVTESWWSVSARRPAVTATNYQLVATRPTLGGLTWVEAPRTEPEAGEIELRVDAVGLNYKDVAKQLDLVSDEQLQQTFVGSGLGMELSGIVERLGPNVVGYQPGERLAATLRGGGFSRYVTCRLDDTRLIRPLDEWTAVESAATLVAFCTAHRAIAEIGGLQAGEIALIHSATGAVGIAASQVIRRLGGRIFATASTPGKRDLARELGAERTFDSRSLNFVEEVLDATQGRGVDVVLNTLPGDGLRANLKVAAEGARVIDIGKQEILNDGTVPLHLFDKNLTFAAFDLDHFANGPEQFTALAERVIDHARRRDYWPSHITRFPAANVNEAFTALARAEHVGKLVIDLADSTDLHYREPSRRAGPIRPDRHYLITGGTGGLGPQIARWLTYRGARHVVLMSRSGLVDQASRSLVAELRREGANIEIAAVDVTDGRALGELLDRLRSTSIPLGGIIHAAGISHDAPLAALTPDDLHLVARPKLTGAVTLHEATLDDPLDLFVLTSSVSSLTGTSGQTAYAAANTAIEAFTHWRRRQGRPATAVALGPVAEAGMAARHRSIERYIELLGFTPLPLDKLPAILDRVLEWNRPQLGLFELDWQHWSDAEPQAAHSTRFADLVARATAQQDRRTDWTRFAALPHAERVATLTEIVTGALAAVLELHPEELDPETPLTDLGLDSLMLLELQTQLNRSLGADLTLMGIIGADTIRKAASTINERLKLP